MSASPNMFSALLEAVGIGFFAEFDFMQRALVGCLTLSLSAAPVGVFLMLRRMSLTGDAMAHAILPGAAIGYLVAGLSVSAMTIGGIAAGLTVVLASGLVARRTVLNEDTSLASFYLLSLAMGVLIVSVKGNNVDLLHVLFGSVLALNNEALILLAGIASLTCVALAIFYRVLIAECLDPEFLRTVSRWSPFVHIGFLFLVVLNLVAGFHALGTLLAVGFMVLPAAVARLWCRHLHQLIVIAIIVAIIGSWVGLSLSYQLDLPSGPVIVLTMGLLYLVSLLMSRVGWTTITLRPHTQPEVPS